MPLVRSIARFVMVANFACCACPVLADTAIVNTLPAFSLEADRIVSGDVQARGVMLGFDADGHFRFSSRQLGFPGAIAALDEFQVQGWLQRLDFGAGGLVLESLLDYSGLEAAWSLQAGPSGLESRLEFGHQPLRDFGVLPAVPDVFAWLKDGFARIVIQAAWSDSDGLSIEYELDVDRLSFDSPDGQYAGEGVGFTLSGSAEEAEPGLRAGTRGFLQEGELLLGNLYLDLGASPVEWLASHAWNAEQETLSGSIRIIDPGAVNLAATFEISEWGSPTRSDVRIDRLRLEFPGAWQQYLEPVAAAWTLAGLEVTGVIEWSGAWQGGALRSGDLVVSDLSVVDTAQNRFALTGLNTRLQPGAREVESMLSWRGLLLGRVNLGPGEALLDSQPGRFALLRPLELGVLGGSLTLNELSYTLPHARAEGRDHAFLSASLRGLEMQPLTRALGWPEFSGTINGELPGASLSNGVFSLLGGIQLDVFGGEIRVDELEIERPFGVLPSLSANMGIRDLDLEQLTETFSFGHIGGRVDGYVQGLRVLDWEPVAFDAWLGTPQEAGKAGKISRKAVHHLASIGGGGTAAALASPLLKMFSQFSYKRIGLGCRLENHVCEVSGVAEDGEGVLLMEGAGLPKITIRAYNRRVDWPQMLANLSAIADGGSIEVGTGSNP